jgi:hypothetical protein
MAVKSIRAAKVPVRIEGSSDKASVAFNPDHYDDGEQYNVRLRGVVNYPEGSENWLTPDSAVVLSGKAIKAIGGEKIATAVKFTTPEPLPSTEAAPSSTNLFSVKGFKAPASTTRR